VIPLLTVDQIRAAESQAMRGGRSERDLMVEAGTRVAAAILERTAIEDGSVLVLCGPGKNGGDGLVAAGRLIEGGWSARAWGYKRSGLDGAPVDEVSADQIRWLRHAADLEDAVRQADVVIDAVFGLGGRAELPRDVVSAFEVVQATCRELGVAIWALDLPSGVDADSGEVAAGAIEADVTAVIGLPKIGLFRFPAARHTGYLKMIDIGLEPPETISDGTPSLITEAYVRARLPRRRAGAHKRSVGTLLVVSGGPHYYGAPRLASEAALRSGAGLVTLAAPSAIIASVAAAVPELTFLPLPGGEHGQAGVRMGESVLKRVKEYKAMLAGPGLGTEAPIPDFLSTLFGLERSTRGGIGFGVSAPQSDGEPFRGKAVLDADALNWLSTRDEWWQTLKDADLILTPHPGELARLLSCDTDDVLENPWDAANRAARTFGQIVVLKHGHSVVADPNGGLLVAPQALPSLATAGSGDVLAGLIGSLLSQGLSARDAAACALYVGLEAAESAEEWSGTLGLIASDIVAELPLALSRLTEPHW
jgi:ADP-dependent NAD(P)H-hydrate dehydratase / NAD(P)H-hydrate epimerase